MVAVVSKVVVLLVMDSAEMMDSLRVRITTEGR